MNARADIAPIDLSPEDLLGHLPPIEEALLLLDFDGTLVALADRPDGVVVPEPLPGLLAALHARARGAMAIVTGRDLDAILGFLPDAPGDIFASHGAERRVDGVRRSLSTPRGFEAQSRTAAEWVAERDGLLFERKPLSFVVHYRLRPDAEDAARKVCEDAAAALDGYGVARAKMAFEVKPRAASKAAAVARMGRRFPDRSVVAFGDDVTDEAMFDPAMAEGGVAVKVGEGPTSAPYRLAAPSDVLRILHLWLESSPQ